MLAALLAILVLGAATATAPAGNRNPDVALDAIPGPAAVTFGENVAYTATLLNNGSSTFTHVEFRMQAPSTLVDGSPVYASKPVYVSCDTDGVLEGYDEDTDTYTCPGFGMVPPSDAPVRITLVWPTPVVDSDNLVCDAPGADPAVNDCKLTALGSWSIKERQPGTNDTFAVEEVSTLLVEPDPKKAAGYAVEECVAGSTDASVVTNDDVGAGNAVATAVCATSVPAPDLQDPGDALFDPGLVIQVEESNTVPLPPGLSQRIVEASFICIPEPGDTCPSTAGYGNAGYLPWVFDPPAQFTFVIDNAQLPKGEKIDQVFHNGVLLPSVLDPAVVKSIKVNNKLKITTVVVEGPTQGGWDFG